MASRGWKNLTWKEVFALENIGFLLQQREALSLCFFLGKRPTFPAIDQNMEQM